MVWTRLRYNGRALQKFPSSPDLWIEAARFEYERNFNITGARNLLLRSLRLNPERRELWLEYARLETLYIFKILERRRVLGLDDKSRMEEKAWDDKDFDGQNEITLPTITADDLETDGSKTESILNPRLADVSKNAALNGAIPTMVYSSATSACPNDILLLVGFYDMFLSFHPIVPFINSILDTIKHDMGEKFPGRGYTLLVQIKDCIRGVRADDAKFPAAVREMMNMAHAISSMSMENRKECCTGLLKFIQGLSEMPDLEENIGEVLKIFQRRVMKWV
jgi:U3 small nucleolar RNA-associated protein 6